MRLEELVISSARRAPDAIAALNSRGEQTSYLALAAHMEAVANALKALGIRAGDRVGLCVPKTINALGAIFGVLKAGASYVPVDYAAPSSRNGYIFSDCAAAAVIVDASVADALEPELQGGPWKRSHFPVSPSEAVEFVLLSRQRKHEEPFAPEPELAYILYTSGSTGRPKGVVHSHETALAFIDWVSQEFQPSADDRFSSHAPFHFDLSILDIYVPMKHGASVVLISSEAGKQPGTLAELIEKTGITIWYSTPSILRMLMEFGKLGERDCSALRIVNFAGEVFPTKHLRNLMAQWPGKAFYNLYGPTETNVCTFYKVPAVLPDDPDYTLPIGIKCSGDELRIVTPEGTEAGRGKQGELIVAGGSVMLRYWNLPERNAEAFMAVDGRSWYRTGDIVHEDMTGNLIFVGRRDRMIKRRGFRVELGEIEAALLRHPSISEAAVVALAKEDGEVEVRAFYTWREPTPASLLKLKQFCAANLPLYMVPDRLISVVEMPKTSTDKIDYQRLKEIG
jgi:amino acid adenylation domain-containing protein